MTLKPSPYGAQCLGLGPTALMVVVLSLKVLRVFSPRALLGYLHTTSYLTTTHDSYRSLNPLGGEPLRRGGLLV